MRYLIAALALAACSGGDQNAGRQTFATEFPPPAGRALRLEDYYRIKDAGSPRISPDARWVVYTVSTPDEQTNETTTESWIVRADGSAPPRRVQHQGTDVESPQWTDDGLLRYTAGRASWTLDVNRPAARPVRARDDEEGIASPDGRWVARLPDVPRDATPVELSDFERRHEARFQGVQFDWLGFQRDGAPFPAPDLSARPAQEIVLRPAKGGGEERALTTLGLRPGDLTWHPNSSLLAFTADAEWRDERSYADPDLYLVTLEGNVTRLTTDGYNHGSLAFSPDGRFLSYTRSFGTDMIIEQRLKSGGPRDLYIWAIADEDNGNGPRPLNLTAGWDLEPQAPRWSPDSRFLYFTAETGGAEHLFRVPTGGGEVEQITQGERRLGSLSVDRSFTSIAYTLGLFETPDEVYLAAMDGSNERKLTSVHDEIAREITFSRAERLWYRSRDGTPVEGWLLYPYGYHPANGPYPMIVHSHGGPHSASGYGFNFKHQLFAAHGFFVLQTNFRSSTGYGDAFKWATWGAWGDQDGEDVMAGVDYAIDNFPIDRNRVGSIGHSYGGFMTNWLIARYPDRFAAAASGAGISNWVSDYGTADIARTKETEFFGTPWITASRNRMIRQSPLTYAGQVRTPTLFVHGEVDQRVPYEEAEQMYVALKKNGVPAKVIQYADQPHGIRGAWNNVHRAMHELRWFEKYLKP